MPDDNMVRSDSVERVLVADQVAPRVHSRRCAGEEAATADAPTQERLAMPLRPLAAALRAGALALRLVRFPDSPSVRPAIRRSPRPAASSPVRQPRLLPERPVARRP